MVIMISWTYLHILMLCLPVLLASSYEIRPATSLDVSSARKILFQEAMNPLSISTETLLVASENQYETNGNYNDNALMGFGQIRPLNDEYSELASIYVMPNCRHQGVGTALVSKLLEKHDNEAISSFANHPQKSVCLLTLRPTVLFYQKHSFLVVTEKDMVPPPLRFEYAAGSVLSAILGNDIVCMVRE